MPDLMEQARDLIMSGEFDEDIQALISDGSFDDAVQLRAETLLAEAEEVIVPFAGEGGKADLIFTFVRAEDGDFIYIGEGAGDGEYRTVGRITMNKDGNILTAFLVRGWTGRVI